MRKYLVAFAVVTAGSAHAYDAATSNLASTTGRYVSWARACLDASYINDLMEATTKVATREGAQAIKPFSDQVELEAEMTKGLPCDEKAKREWKDLLGSAIRDYGRY